ncbi:GNAT family protein [Anaerolineales bacterium]
MDQFPHLESDRLCLTAFSMADKQAILAQFSDPLVARYISKPFHALEEAEKWLHWMISDYEKGRSIRWAIRLKPTLTLIGSIGLHDLKSPNRNAELGYDLASAYWGQSYASEAIQTVIAYAWEVLKLNRIEADVVSHNLASIHLLEKFGFQKEGCLRERFLSESGFLDVFYYGLLKTDCV